MLLPCCCFPTLLIPKREGWALAKAHRAAKVLLSAPGSKGSIKGNLSVGTNYSQTPAPDDGAIIQGRVGIGTTNPDNSSVLEINSDSKGVLFPRLTTAQRNAIANAVAGLLVYDTDAGAFYYFDGIVWRNVSSSGQQGATGATGETGAKGDTGDKGDTGAKGDKGDDGAAGVQGAQGVTGITGNPGAQGVTGATGLLQNGTAAGQTPRWDGSNWVIDNNIYNNGGNVGIGTGGAPASAKLEVNGSSTFKAVNQGATTTERFYPNVISDRLDNNVDGAWIIHSPIPRASNIMFKIRVHGYGYGNADVIDFTISGYAYSGTTGSVDGAAGAVINYKMSDVGTDNWNKRIGINSSGNVAVAFGDHTSSAYFYRLSVDVWITRTTNDYASGWSIDRNTASGFNWNDIKGPLTSTLKNSVHILPGGNIRLQNYTGGTLQVDGSGNLGVGTGSNVLTAGNGLSWSGNTLNSVWTASGNDISNNNSGNVGIGSAAGTLKLKVAGDIEASGQIRATGWLTGAGTGQGAEIGVSSGYSYFFGYNRSTSAYTPVRMVGSTIDLRHSDAGSDLFVNTSGNVGVGTNDPAYKLHVYGAAGTAPLAIQNADGGVSIGAQNASYLHIQTDRPRFYFNRKLIVDEGIISSYNQDLNLQTSETTRISVSNSTGNVGIGMSGASAKLEVNGQVKITGGSPGEGKYLRSDANGLATWDYATNPWESMGSNVRQVCNNNNADLNYEWGITYNNSGTILRVTCNRWNTGFRVCSYPPYPTGDVEPFVWGGVCWIWETTSTWDNSCSIAYHSYYYQDTYGKYYMGAGNGCDMMPGVYRRKL